MKRTAPEKKTIEFRSGHHTRYHLFGKARIKLLLDKTAIDACIANISFSGVGLYAPVSIPNGRQVKIKISFFDGDGKIQNSVIEGRIIWHSKLGTFYLVGIRFNEVITTANQPLLFKRLLPLRSRRI
jgi:hypothetical protein